MHLRGVSQRLYCVLVGFGLLTMCSVARARPLDKSLHGTPLPLHTWMAPETLSEDWSDRPVHLADVYLVSEGPAGDEIYASFCPGARQGGCPFVYLGKLPDEARAAAGRVGEQQVTVYLTVGQIVPRRFAAQFGMLESRDGAWIEWGRELIFVEPDSRVFGVREQPAAVAATVAPQPPTTADEARSYFTFGCRSMRDDDRDDEVRPVGRKSLIAGRTEFVVRTSAQEWYRVEEIEVTGQEGIYVSGGRQRLCRSSTTPDSCVADFGSGIAGQRFRIAAAVRVGSGERFTLTEDFVTLDTHPSRIGTNTAGVHRERQSVESPPPDEVVRLLRVETVVGRGDERRVEYRTDLPPEVFRLDVAGIKGATVRSVSRPSADTPLLIPIFLSVSPYFFEQGQNLGWTEKYSTGATGVVLKLSQGIERAAWNGIDAEFLVVDYAATARRFGPFRLYPGRQLSDEQKLHNRRTLDALAAHLRQPPLPEWNKKRLDSWVSDLSSPLHAMNDLFFRTYPGLVSILLVTDGWNNPETTQPRLQRDLWPERIELLNRVISAERAETILDLLDQGRTLHHAAIDRLLATETDVELTPERLTAYLRGFDPGGTSTLHPHRENHLPPLDALVNPSAAWLRPQAQELFSTMIRDDFGGEIYRLYTVRKGDAVRPEQQLDDRRQSGATLSFSQMIERIHQQLRASYVVVSEVPNQKQDGARHTLRFEATESVETGKGKTKTRKIDGRLHYMPYYTSSRSVREKLPMLARSPFVLLRVLAAYELRHHWDDPGLYELLEQRRDVEADPVVGQVLFETAIAINLKRLQISAAEIEEAGRRQRYRREAHERLQAFAEDGAAFADALLAQDAARLAGQIQGQPED